MRYVNQAIRQFRQRLVPIIAVKDGTLEHSDHHSLRYRG